jgi:hypothetical protein
MLAFVRLESEEPLYQLAGERTTEAGFEVSTAAADGISCSEISRKEAIV